MIRRRHIKSLIIIALLFLGCNYYVKNLDNLKGETVVCFGDSITSGVGVRSEESYPSLLSHLIKRGVINEGRAGDTTYSALLRLNDVIAHKPFLVIIELGGNDYLRGVPLENTLENLQKIIREIQKRGTVVAICDISSGPFLSYYRKKFKELAKEEGAIFIPEVLRGILTDPSLKVDSLHPNKEGHRIIAERIYNALSKYFEF